MASHFYAYMARMKLIKRWGLRRSVREENDQEHSLQVAMIAHALAVIRNRRYGGSVDPGRVALLAIYHEAPEVITGDLASVGHGVVTELFRRDGMELGDRYQDCGMLLYDQSQDVHAGASGCGCSAAVLCGRILPDLASGKLKKVLFCGTGAMMSPTSANQGESIPGICHLVCLEGGL